MRSPRQIWSLPEENRRARFEEKYYVDYPDILTIEDFAREVEELNKW